MDFDLQKFPDGTVCMTTRIRTALGVMPFAFIFPQREWFEFVDMLVHFSEHEFDYLSNDIPQPFKKAFE